MKAHWTQRLSLLPLALCGLLLFAPDMALAQAVDADGRSASDRAARGSFFGEPQNDGATQDVWRGCDQDECVKGKVERASEDTIIEGLTPGSTLSLKIQNGAPENSMHIAKTGDIGLGTEAPGGRLHIVARPGEGGADDIFLLDDAGNLELGGLLSEASSMYLKENFAPVDGQGVLDVLSGLPIMTWNYKTDDVTVRHMGPMAQDFYAAFGLGADAEHLASLDVNGVALAAIKALYEQSQAQAERIATLEAMNAALMQRLDALVQTRAGQ